MPKPTDSVSRQADPVRLATVRAYAAFREGGTFRPVAPVSLRDSQQRRLYANLLRGMVRHCRRLEAEASRLARRPPAQLTSPVMAALVLGLHQVLDLKQADHAAVYETVELLGTLGQNRAKGLVNAVLRTALRERERGERASSLSLAQRTSHPDWLVDRWVRQFGAEVTARICEANNRFETSGVRVNRARIGREALRARLAAEGVESTDHPLLPGALLVPHLSLLLDSASFSEGLCYVQDASSQLLGEWLARSLHGAVLDACCAPGGKLTHLAELSQCNSDAPTWLVGMDSSPDRLVRVRENFGRLRLGSPLLVAGDARRLPFGPVPPPGGWKTVILDAPCSATGMIRKYPELKWRRHVEDLARLGQIQAQLLDAAAQVLAPDGRIVYITCSLESEENEDQVNAFLTRTPGFRRLRFTELPAPEGLGEPVAGLVTAAGDLQVLPDGDRMGIFAAILVPRTNA
jgi:16S rRNA (cytosine967-C5)-methyltransferase